MVLGDITVVTDREFDLLADFIRTHTGIALGPHKHEMLTARLGRRLRALGLPSFMAYYRLLQHGDPAGEERCRLVNAITTNVTGFFREEHHFRFLAEKWLPALVRRAGRAGQRRLRIWSAGCSSGEEPYSIAAAVVETLGDEAAQWDFRVLASDIDTNALQQGAAATYPLEEAATIPRSLLEKHFLRGTGANAGLFRVRPEIQPLVAFRRINLMDDPWPIRTRFDAIFCRNVLIYFDRPTQQRLVQRLTALLAEDGLLFLGHSEGLRGLFAGLAPVENTINRRTRKSAGALPAPGGELP